MKKFASLFFVLIFVQITFSVAFARPSECKRFLDKILASDLEITHRLFVSQNRFEKNRGFNEYQLAFYSLDPDKNLFAETLKSLTPQDHLMDAGCGNGHFIADLINFQKTHAYITGVSYKIETSFFIDQIDTRLASEKIQLISGHYFEEINDELITHQWGGLKMITDVLGVLSYTHSLSETLQRYLDLLEVDGTLFAYFHPNKITISNENKVQHVENWLKSIADITFIQKGSALMIRKIGPNPKVPPLIPQAYHNTTPPTRQYTWQ